MIVLRDIRFRAWDRKAKAMFPVHKLEWHKISNELVHLSGVDIHHKDSDHEGDVYYGGHPSKMTGTPGTPQVKRFELMQFTGLKDQTGIEIYEGDIIENSFSKRDDFCYKCIWYGESGQWMFDPFMKGDAEAPLLGIEEFLQDWETVGLDNPTVMVIGNVHENPELLEGSKHGT